MKDKKCKICGKELKNNNGFLCGEHKAKLINGAVEVGRFAFFGVLAVVAKGKFKGKK